MNDTQCPIKKPPEGGFFTGAKITALLRFQLVGLSDLGSQ